MLVHPFSKLYMRLMPSCVHGMTYARAPKPYTYGHDAWSHAFSAKQTAERTTKRTDDAHKPTTKWTDDAHKCTDEAHTITHQVDR